MTAGAAILLRSRLGWAADTTDPRVAGIVAKTIGIDTHNHIDVPLTATETQEPNMDLAGELKRSGLSAICMTFATDYQPGDAYDRFLKGLASMDRQLERNNVKRSLTPGRRPHGPIRITSQRSSRRSKVVTSYKAILSGWKKPTDGVCGILGCFTTATLPCRSATFTPTRHATAD